MTTNWIGFVFWRASVLDCGSPLPLLRRQSCRGKSGRGLPHSKTSRNFSDALANHGHSFIRSLELAACASELHFGKFQKASNLFTFTPSAPGDGCHEANEIYHVRGVQGTARPTLLRR
jgi:hypothetical protein